MNYRDTAQSCAFPRESWHQNQGKPGTIVMKQYVLNGTGATFNCEANFDTRVKGELGKSSIDFANQLL